MENPFLKPKIEKIVINIGLKEALVDKKILEIMTRQLAQITGQKPIVTKARKAIAGFKLKKGDPIGLKVTLRGKRMDDFFQKLIKIVLPRIHDFRGVPLKSFDGKGNYTLGINDISVFPEVEFIKTERVKGLELTIVTTAKTNEEAKKLLEEKGMPFSS